MTEISSNSQEGKQIGQQEGKKVVIELDNVKRNFLVGDEVVHALKGVSFKIYEGEFVTIMGKSGSGKSTLLNQLGCLDTPSSGEYYLDGVSVRTMSRNDRAILRNRKIGFIFQNYNLLPKTTSVENVELPLMYNPNIGPEERKNRAIEALKAEQINKVYLIAFTRNEGGNAFWKKVGWQCQDDRNYYDLNLNEANMTVFNE